MLVLRKKKNNIARLSYFFRIKNTMIFNFIFHTLNVKFTIYCGFCNRPLNANMFDFLSYSAK